MIRATPLLLLAATASAAAAQRVAPRVPVAEAVPRAGIIRIDGRLDEPAWERAPEISGFVQREPVEGAPAEHPTIVRVMYDDEAIYVGARLSDPDPSSIARQLVRRDAYGQYDLFEVAVDPDLDRRTGYQFGVSAAGVQRDSYLYEDVQEDDSWNAVWESAVAIDSLGWTAELRIPLSQIRFDASPNPQRWGVNFTRRRVATNEVSDFALLSRLRHGRVSAFGELGGIVLREGGRRLELRPYALVSARTAPAHDGDPFFDGRESTAEVGVDLRYGLGSTFTVDATINPDFGQVEVDPAVINLSAFETFYPERRPFFVEDARIFDFRISGRANTLFYSRRIGREPLIGRLAGAEFHDVPSQSSIVGAAKVTGRTVRGLSVGALAALTGPERGVAYFLDGDSVRSFLAEPRSAYAVGRAEQSLRDGATVFGGILTGVWRELDSEALRARSPRTALGAGINFEHTWSDRAYALSGHLAGTFIHGSEAAITRIQRSSVHYFQRPDAEYLEVDSSATSLAGLAWQLELERRSGEHWTWGAWIGERTPGFDPNDVGYLSGSEELDAGGRLQYQEITPGRVFRSYEISAFTVHNWRHSVARDPWSIDAWRRAYTDAFVNLEADATFLNYWSAGLGVFYRPRSYDGTATRGGPLMVDPARLGIGGRASTDSRRWLTFEPSGGIEFTDGAEGPSYEIGVGIEMRPSSRIELSVEPQYQRAHEPAQYVATITTAPYAPTFGSRYIFGALEQRTVSLETRLDVTFTPTLTLQLFAQPLLAAGEFTRYQQLREPATFAFDVFTEGTAMVEGEDVRCIGGQMCRVGETQYVDVSGDQVADFDFGVEDFRVRSLRGNAVLRWEYRPGSSLYVVWQQQREFEDLDARAFDLGRDAAELFRGDAENVFIVKLNYWLAL